VSRGAGVRGADTAYEEAGALRSSGDRADPQDGQEVRLGELAPALSVVILGRLHAQ
jgi:hypothetical protein